MREDTRGRVGRGAKEIVLWGCSRHGARSGQGGLRVLQMLLKSGCVPAVFGGAMISMGRTLEKPGPALYSPECVDGKFSEVRRTCTLGASNIRRMLSWTMRPCSC